MGLWSFYLYGKRTGDPIHGSRIQFFLLLCALGMGAWYRRILLQKHWNLPGDTIGFGKRYSGSAYRSSGLRRDKTHRKSSRMPSAAGIRDLYFIFPAGTFIMRRPHTRCVFKDFPVCFWDPADFRRDRRFCISKVCAMVYPEVCFPMRRGLVL